MISAANDCGPFRLGVDPFTTADLRQFALVGQLLKILSAFQRSNVGVLPLKGPVLAQQLYGDSTERRSDDLDLLVRKGDARRAISVLEAEGYALRNALDWISLDDLIARTCELSFEPASWTNGGISVDLHWEIAPSDNPFHFDPEVLWSNVEAVDVAGRRLLGLRAECQLWFLAMHGAKHAWSRRMWVRDIARLIEITPRMNWDHVFELAGVRGGEQVVLLAAMLARDLEGVALPAEIDRRVRGDRVIASLAAQALEYLRTEQSPNGFEVAHFNARLANRRWDRIRHYAAMFKAPTQADARAVRLPRELFLLYYPVRAGRLIYKYTQRLFEPQRTGAGRQQAL